LVGKSQGKTDTWEIFCTDGRKILKRRKRKTVCGLNWLNMRPTGGGFLCEHDNEPSGSINAGNSLVC
jgi:hypothetical protein